MVGSTITAIKSGAAVFGRNKILGQYTLTATFSKISAGVGLGVVDTLNKNGWKNYNLVYYRSDSYCYVGGVGNNKNIGFKANERVTVFINLKSGSIQWKVGS